MKLNYRKLGNGRPLFVLHGLFGLSDNWATVGKMLSENFEVYLIDLRNHGISPHSNDWTYPLMAKDIAELIKDQLPNHPIALLGHSLGGKVAMQFAAMYPELLEKLIVVDIAPKDYPENQFTFIEKLLSVNLAEMKTRKEVETALTSIINNWANVQLLLKNVQWVPLPQSSSSQEENNKEVLAWKFNLKVIAENQNTIGNTFSLGAKPINTPTLFIRGERSNYILDADIPEIKKHFPNSALKTIADAGHWVHADKPKEFVEEVNAFLL